MKLVLRGLSRWSVILAAASVTSVSQAQSRPDPADILKKVGEVYSAASKYELESSVEIRLPNGGAAKAYSIHLWLSAPDKYRLETSGEFCPPGVSDCPPGVHKLSIVYRGDQAWSYSVDTNEYREDRAPNLQRDTRPEDVDLYFGAGMFRHAPQTFAEGRLLRSERLTIEGQDVDCDVVEIRMGSVATTLWVEKDRHLVRRMESNGEGFGAKATYRVVRLSEPIADDLFNFKPRAGARKVDGAFGKSK